MSDVTGMTSADESVLVGDLEPGLPEAPQPTPLTPGTPGSLSPVEWARWFWRQLTSMRTALLLLFLLSIAAIPGSVIPQEEGNPLAASAWRARNPGLSPWVERFGLFDVYSSVWFSAIYLLLMLSLVGCIIPRSRLHWRASRARPPAPPRNLSRLSVSRKFEVESSPDEVLVSAQTLLRKYRVDRHQDVGFGHALSAERGYLRETGNLLFHISVVALLLAVAVGGLYGYRASVLVVSGDGFANSPIQYDSLETGAFFDASSLPPFTLTLNEFLMEFRAEQPNRGSAEAFTANVTMIDAPGSSPRDAVIEVNHPLKIDGTSVHILNPGYAPVITVRNPDGEVLFSQPVPFLPQDGNFASVGVAKVENPTGPDLGIQAFLFPTAVADSATVDASGQGQLRSVFPDLVNPALVLRGFRGDLGLDDGVPESVFRLDTRRMAKLTNADGTAFSAALGVGETAELPSGYTVTFDGVETWVNFQVSSRPFLGLALVSAATAVIGLLASLYVRRRRIWVRVSAAAPGRTVVEVAGLDRADGGNLDEEIDALVLRLGAPKEYSQ